MLRSTVPQDMAGPKSSPVSGTLKSRGSKMLLFIRPLVVE